MASKQQSLDKVCKALLRRTRYDSTKKQRLRVYATSLQDRLVSIRFAFDRLRDSTTSINYNVATTTQWVTGEQERDFFANAFWSFSYSMFDILAHVLNVLYPIVKTESKVSFLKAADGYADLTAKHRGACPAFPPKLLGRLQATVADGVFVRLASYRQCCLHRRQVALGAGEARVTPSSSYVASTAKGELLLVAWICDDVDAINPEFNKQTQLMEECKAIGMFVSNEITEILRLL